MQILGTDLQGFHGLRCFHGLSSIMVSRTSENVGILPRVRRFVDRIPRPTTGSQVVVHTLEVYKNYRFTHSGPCLLPWTLP